eukprot:gene30411-36742_t
MWILLAIVVGLLAVHDGGAVSFNITKTNFPQTFQIAGIAVSANGQYVVVPQCSQSRNYGKGYIYHSSDSGASFKMVPSNYPQPYYGLSMTLDGKHAIATATIQYLSSDYASTWTAASLANENPSVVRIDSETGRNVGMLYLNASPCLALSQDYGKTFSALRGPVFNASSFCQSFAMSDDLQTIVVRVDGEGFFTSQDQGATWSLTFPATETMDFAASLVYNPHTGHFWGARYTVVPEKGVAYVEVQLLRSLDRGVSWQPMRTGIRQHEGQFAVSADEQTILLGTSGGGVYVSLDGGAAFQKVSPGEAGGYFVALNAQGTEFYYMADDDFLYKGSIVKEA